MGSRLSRGARHFIVIYACSEFRDAKEKNTFKSYSNPVSARKQKGGKEERKISKGCSRALDEVGSVW